MKGYIIKHMKKQMLIIIIFISFLLSFNSVYAKEIIIGPDTLMIPYIGESIAQYDIVEGAKVKKISKNGISINQEGLLTVTKEALPQTINVTVSYYNKTYHKQVTLYRPWSYEKEEFKKYQMKETIEPINLPSSLINPMGYKVIRYTIISICLIIMVGYLYKRREKD